MYFQPIFNVRDRLPLGDHSHGARMAEAVGWIDRLQPFGTERPVKILLTDTIDTMASIRHRNNNSKAKPPAPPGRVTKAML